MANTEISPWEHLQDVWRKVHNKRVREHFRDIIGNDTDWDNWTPDLNIARQSLCKACRMEDGDTADMTNMRILLFWLVLGQAQALQVPVYGIPVPGYQEARKFKPQIQLYFQEDVNDVEEGYSPVTGEISVRLMREESDTLTETEVRAYANKVKTNFSTGAGFVWQKGRIMCSYTDATKGYKLQLLCRTKTEGKRVVEQVLDLQGHSPDWDLFNTSENESPSTRYPTIPRNQRILGRTRKGVRQRPIASVRFKYAALHIHGLPNPIILLDRSGRFRNPIVNSRD